MLSVPVEGQELVAGGEEFLFALFGIAVHGFLAFGQAEAVRIERAVRAGFDLRRPGLLPKHG